MGSQENHFVSCHCRHPRTTGSIPPPKLSPLSVSATYLSRSPPLLPCSRLLYLIRAPIFCRHTRSHPYESFTTLPSIVLIPLRGLSHITFLVHITHSPSILLSPVDAIAHSHNFTSSSKYSLTHSLSLPNFSSIITTPLCLLTISW